MKAIVNSSTGKLLFTTVLPIDEVEGTVILEEEPTGNHWNFEDKVWFNIIDNDELINQALEIDIQYTSMISDLLRKHLEKLTLDNMPIPEEVLYERNRLREECNQKIYNLGINDFSYRSNNLRL